MLNVIVFDVIRWNCYCHDIFRFDEIEWWMKGKKTPSLYSSNPLNKLCIMTLELVMFGLLTSIKYSAGYSTQSQILKIAYEKKHRRSWCVFSRLLELYNVESFVIDWVAAPTSYHSILYQNIYIWIFFLWFPLQKQD